LKQSISKKNRAETAFLYLRLSRDDNLEGESYSIQNQKIFLTKAAKDMGYKNLHYFTDDGVSGVTMNRPGFKAMMDELEKGYAQAVFVKDLSRLGRNYVEVGKLMDTFFPEHDIRLVAVSDAIDTFEGESEMAPIKNVFNEWYARDISKKRRISNKIKGNSGIPMGPPPYGYRKDPDDPKHWVIDEEAAAVVRRIYDMHLGGMGIEQIAAQLERDEVVTPNAYWISKGINRPGKSKALPPTHWSRGTVANILKQQAYCGDVINFKTYSKSYKLKKRLDNDPENWVIFRDVHEPIIDRGTWEKVQSKRKNIRKRNAFDGEVSLFSGLLVCADCGCNMHFHFNQANHDIKYFNCSNYKGNRGTCQSTHYVRADFLEEVVLGEIKRLTKYATAYEAQFAEAVMGYSQKNAASDRQALQRSLYAMQARDRELDTLFERIYEDNIAGKLTDERFARMSKKYDEEQKALAQKIRAARDAIDKSSAKEVTADMFISTVRKYTRAKKLTQRMVNELIDRIEVHQAEKVDGVWEQRLTIRYNCVGVIDIPETLPIPAPAVTMNTRKGVYVSYAVTPAAS
jgi:site-specific DNA recombinase